MDEVTLQIAVKELDFIVQLLSQVPTGQTLQAGMAGLIPKLAAQAQASFDERKKVAEMTNAAAGAAAL